MSELDRLTRHVTHDVARSAQWPDSQVIRARAGRRTARQAVLAAMAAVVLVAGITFAVNSNHRAPDVPATATPTAPAPVTTTPSAPAPGIVGRQLSFVDNNVGWLLGVAPCAA